MLCFRESVGMSGRMLRKIPFLTYSYIISRDSTSLEQFLEAMEITVVKCKKEKESTESKLFA